MMWARPKFHKKNQDRKRDRDRIRDRRKRNGQRPAFVTFTLERWNILQKIVQVFARNKEAVVCLRHTTGIKDFVRGRDKVVWLQWRVYCKLVRNRPSRHLARVTTHDNVTSLLHQTTERGAVKQFLRASPCARHR